MHYQDVGAYIVSCHLYREYNSRLTHLIDIIMRHDDTLGSALNTGSWVLVETLSLSWGYRSQGFLSFLRRILLHLRLRETRMQMHQDWAVLAIQ